jgi:hypothetical protein
MLGALPLVRDLLARLDLVATIDRLCPVRSDARVTHGQAIAMVIANRLTSPTPLVRIEDWARQWAVEEVFGIPPDAFNDDRIGGRWRPSPSRPTPSSARSASPRSSRSGSTSPSSTGT